MSEGKRKERKEDRVDSDVMRSVNCVLEYTTIPKQLKKAK